MTQLFPWLALSAGAAIAIQAGMNARLGVVLGNTMLGTSIAFAVACLASLLVLVLQRSELPGIGRVGSVPVYLWWGGVISAFGVGLLYFLIPRMGMGPMTSFALTGQIVLAVICSHFGWFDQPVRPINGTRLVGMVVLVAGVSLIYWEKT
ncbi:MAG: DMT family transporter [Oceanospirillales bacterium]|uniref:Transporter family-2 protein n=1 Tax=Marinobacterium halophilum TaxID=267374 RepID=A0A2P8EQG5_9GAMM|nr:DMT family transporter [Marinobacterium halophilum]MBR9829749.1 DMT family transporter [Oceanospirillales bacterium]PSL11705.1 transporter family-2 protein [Marinobacterium halophilum]